LQRGLVSSPVTGSRGNKQQKDQQHLSSHIQVSGDLAYRLFSGRTLK
jgi:hypothetical protein